MGHKTRECKHLLKELLKVDPNSRIPASDAVMHKWLQTQNTQLKVDSNAVTDCFWNFKNVQVLA